MSVHADVRKSALEAERANNLYHLSMQVFLANAQRGDFIAAEAERVILHGLLDDYMDAMMAANQRLLMAQRS